ncbi:sigma-70 family RNA polymerase sigma factor [Streptomonospora sp. S1-112]|uniref:Sigma-70 family RNA polymerase sigma factor n=1 Tax=Streptomonospora mangrovi TaxID=2883123 RepID=A0A9X3NHH3_9ACTN|nr:sigma-70 family RNA polymerase sigma factor [Streptomonospora mangrovi]MDA0563597.1 sigma-70 family RNA polymerase sigma factor [Streptomonospora mangrovi]
MEADDRVLLARVADGDEHALRVLYGRHAAAMLRLLRRLTSDTGTAEEILQEAWLAAWRSAAGYRGESAVRVWLLGITRRRAHDRLRRVARPTVDLDDAPEPVDGGVDVEEQVLATIGHDAILAAVRRLPARSREVLGLALVDELPYRDIADVLGVPVGTVKSRMAHARARLIRLLTEEEEEGHGTPR